MKVPSRPTHSSLARCAHVLAGLLLVIGCGAAPSSEFLPDDKPGGETPGEGGSSSGGFGKDGRAELTVQPKNATVIIDTTTDPPTPGTLTYAVKANGADVSSEATFQLDTPGLGSFSGATFTSVDALPDGTRGVSAVVKATTPDGGVGLGQLTVVQLRNTGQQRDFFFVVPYMGDPTPPNDVLEFGTTIKQVDVAFAMDTTGSMGNSITNLKNALANTLLGDLQAAIPDVGLAIVDYKDYPYLRYGLATDWPVKVHQKITTSLLDAQNAVAKYNANSGSGDDGPESMVPAMYHILTGAALTWPTGSIPAATPAPGRWGAVDFRPGAVPVIVNITDAPWHNGTNAAYDYSFPAPNLNDLKTAFQDKSAFFVNVTNGTETEANELSDATGSNVPTTAFGPSCAAGKCCNGVNGAAQNPTGPGGSCRLNFRHSSGNGVASGITTAIQAISVGATYDVTTVVSNDPANADGVDATQFIHALRAMGEGDAAAGCPAGETKDSDGDGIDDTFLKVTVGTKVCFQVIPAKNTTVPPQNDPQFYNAIVNVVGVQGNVQLDSRTVLFLVPPKDPSVQ